MLLNKGDYAGYYKLACAGGDTYACSAGEIAAGNSAIAKYTTSRLQAYAIEDRGSALSPNELDSIRLSLATGYANSLGSSPLSAVQPDGMQIARIHWNVFQSFNVYSPSAFGGTPLGGAHLILGPWFMKEYPAPFGGAGWCTICK